MTDDNDASPARVTGILVGLRTREWPEGETAFVSRDEWAKFIETLAADRDLWKAEAKRLREACSQMNEEISQTLGRALGYPKFCDDQKNFPGATDDDGVCVGEHVAESLAIEAAHEIGRWKTETEAMRERCALYHEAQIEPEGPSWGGITGANERREIQRHNNLCRKHAAAIRALPIEPKP